MNNYDDNKVALDPVFQTENMSQAKRSPIRLYEPIGMSPAELLDDFYYKMAPARRVHYKKRISELESLRGRKTTRLCRGITRDEILK